MEDSCSETDINEFPFKSKVCVVCASLINEDLCDFVPEESQQKSDGRLSPLQSQHRQASICSENFLKGLSVLCKVLKIDNSFTEVERWTIAEGKEDFVGYVCCRECYALFEKLLTLHELIVATQTSLQEDVRAIQQCIVQSQNKDVEYSINICLEFREDVVKNFAETCLSAAPQFSCSPEVPIDDDQIEDFGGKNYSSEFYSENENVSQTDQRKRGRPCKRSEISMEVKGKRGRPRKNVQISDSETSIPEMKRKSGRPKRDKDNNPSSDGIQEENSEFMKDPSWSPYENEIFVKRKRGRPKTEKPESDKSIPLSLAKRKRGRSRKDERPNICEEDNVEEAESDSLSIESQKSVQKTKQSARRIVRKVHATKRQKCKYLKPSDANESLKRPPGRPRKSDKNFLLEGPRRHPVYALKVSCKFLMYLHVKFLKETSAFRCQHPDCSHVVPITGYFTEQAAYKSMRLHIKNFHRNKYQLVGQERQKYYYCCHCEIQSKCLNDLLVHKRNEHPEDLPPPVVCEVCGDVMHHQLLTKHLFSHKNEDEKALVPVVSKQIKIKTRTPTLKTYSCGQCLKVYRTKSQRNLHEESHIPVELRKHVICDICGIKVTCVTNLKSHKQRVHFKADMPKPLECRICGKKFMQMDLARYKSHLNSHTGERPFQCSECGKGFFRKWNLTLHERIHNQTSIQCRYCPNWYRSDKYLKRHISKHHPDLQPPKAAQPNHASSSESRADFIGPKLMYPCEPCKKVFVYKSMLIAHLKHKHKMQLEKREDYPNQFNQ